MPEFKIVLPLVIVFSSSLVAALFGLRALNRRLTVVQLSWLLAAAPLAAFGVILSFLLVAYKYNQEAARRSGFKALFITGGGGIALLAGLLMIIPSKRRLPHSSARM